MAYIAYLKDVVEYHGNINITAEYRDPGLAVVRTKTFSFTPATFSVAQAKAIIVAYRDTLNTLDNKIQTMRTFIGQEVT